MKHTLILILAALLMGMGFIGCSDKKTETPPTPKEEKDTVAIMIMQMQRSSRLYSTEAKIRKIIVAEDTKHAKGSFMKHSFDVALPGTARKIAIPIDATVKAYIDMSKINKNSIRRDGKKIEVILPDPEIELTSTKIDNKSIRRHVSFFRSDYTDSELTQLQQRGRNAIINDIKHLDIIRRAQASASRTIIPIVAQMGYKEEDVTITFRRDLTNGSLITILKEHYENN